MTLVAWAYVPECVVKCLEIPVSPIVHYCIDHHIDYLKSSFIAITLDKQHANTQSSLYACHNSPDESETTDLYFASPTYAPTLPCIFGNAVLEYRVKDRENYDTGVKTEWEEPTSCITRLKYLIKVRGQPYQERRAWLSLSSRYISIGERVDTERINIPSLAGPIPRTTPALFRLLPVFLL